MQEKKAEAIASTVLVFCWWYCYLFVAFFFFVNLTQARVIWEEGSASENPSIGKPVGCQVGIKLASTLLLNHLMVSKYK